MANNRRLKHAHPALAIPTIRREIVKEKGKMVEKKIITGGDHGKIIDGRQYFYRATKGWISVRVKHIRAKKSAIPKLPDWKIGQAAVIG